jgi:hypothetical protein
VLAGEVHERVAAKDDGEGPGRHPLDQVDLLEAHATPDDIAHAPELATLLQVRARSLQPLVAERPLPVAAAARPLQSFAVEIDAEYLERVPQRTEYLVCRHGQRVGLLAARAAGRQHAHRLLLLSQLRQELPQGIEMLGFAEEIGLVDGECLADRFEDRPLAAHRPLQELLHAGCTDPSCLLVHHPRQPLPEELGRAEPETRENLFPDLPDQLIDHTQLPRPSTRLTTGFGRSRFHHDPTAHHRL